MHLNTRLGCKTGSGGGGGEEAPQMVLHEGQRQKGSRGGSGRVAHVRSGHMVKFGADTVKSSSDCRVIGLFNGLHLGFGRHDGGHIKGLGRGSFGHLTHENAVVGPWNPPYPLHRGGLKVGHIRAILKVNRGRGNRHRLSPLVGVPDKLIVHITIGSPHPTSQMQ